MSQKVNTSSFFLAVLALIGIGLVQVYSSSYIYATESFGDGLYFFKKQVLFAGLAIVAMLFVSQMPLQFLRRWIWLFWIFSVAALALTFVPGIGVKVGGAARWVDLPFGFRFEPSEFLKVALAGLLASLAQRQDSEVRHIPWIPTLLLVVLPIVVLLKQPDFGTFVIMVSVVLSCLFLLGLKWRYILSSAVLAIPAFYILVMQVPYRKARVMAFLNPWSDPEEKGFQVIQSMISFSQGGLTGAGLGQGQGKLFFLPEAHTDFTLAVLGEEVGFIGFLALMLIYGLLIFKGLLVASKCRDAFSKVLAACLTVTFALNVLINAGVVLGLLPTKGLTMPFLSYGGSSLVAMSLLFGLLINVEQNYSPSTTLVRRSRSKR